MKSELTSKRVRKSLSRRVTLNRGCSYRTFRDSDLKWFWAAYNKGAFGDVVDRDLGQEDFTAAILSVISVVLEKENAFLVFDAAVKGQGSAPVGIAMVGYIDRAAMPHIHWFPWATDRNKLECTVLFLRDLKKEAMPLILAQPETVPFFSHLARYGLLRRAGTIPNYRENEKSILFHGVV